MIDSLSLRQPIQFYENRKSRFLRLNRLRFTLSWESVRHVNNIALIIAGIAFGFFVQLPWVSFGMAGYGIFYLVQSLRGKGKNPNRAEFDQLQQSLKNAEEKGRGLNEQIQELLRDGGHMKQARRDQKKIKEIAREKKGVDRERRNLKIERDQLKDRIQVLKRSRVGKASEEKSFLGRVRDYLPTLL